VDLPLIDKHEIKVDAPPAAIWEALTDWISRGWSPRASRFAGLLGSEQVRVSGEPGVAGSTFPGFEVVRAQPPRELALHGRHRFSEYTLDFEVSGNGDGSSLSAVTHAAFPGLRGQLYKTAVIRSRAHVVLTRRILRSVARRAERATMRS
jgi:polyketide cyclase/dehydrase/lipid transport protein